MTRPRPPILEEGVTCWRITRAGRVAVLIDGAAYFAALLRALRQARSRILIVGWDFDPRVRLDPCDPTTELRRLLRTLVEERPELHVRVLIWDVSIVFGPSRMVDQLLATGWQQHPRIGFRFDNRHPVGGAQHEKIVCIDDALAFVGGIDLTVDRWDTQQHEFDADARRGPGGAAYDPVHDLQLLVDGEAASRVAELMRARWAAATGEQLAPFERRELWPEPLAPAFTDVPVGIARTRPATDGRTAVQEVAALNVAALAAARRSVYIETQYLAASSVADWLALLLERPDGPEVVIVVWRRAIGWLERFAMGSNRDRLLRRLAAADRHRRLRAYWLGEPAAPQREINLHAKLLIVDDVFLRIGSSNLNNRSLGFDSECDLAIEGADPATRNGIAGVRNQLLAEHLVRPVAEVRRAVAEEGLIAAIERLNRGRGRLRRHRIEPDGGPKEPFPGTPLLDPAEPLELEQLGRRLRRLLADSVLEHHMRQAVHQLTIATDGQRLHEITAQVRDWVAGQGIGQGLLTLFVHHTSASLLVQENADPRVQDDLNAFFRRLVSEDLRHYTHTQEGPDDMPAHIRAALTATHLSIPVAAGRPDLGRWQGIYLYEHRARGRARRITLHLLGE